MLLFLFPAFRSFANNVGYGLEQFVLIKVGEYVLVELVITQRHWPNVKCERVVFDEGGEQHSQLIVEACDGEEAHHGRAKSTLPGGRTFAEEASVRVPRSVENFILQSAEDRGDHLVFGNLFERQLEEFLLWPTTFERVNIEEILITQLNYFHIHQRRWIVN